MSKLFSFTNIQFIPSTLKDVWDFISDPKNLKQITPEYMNFEVITESTPEKIYAGLVIAYKVSPFPGMRVKWVSEITHVQEEKYFVDEQRYGPYKFWHHQHFIDQVSGGVEMKDIIHYNLPLGILGDIGNRILVKNQLKQIFNYRNNKIDEKFKIRSV